MGVEIVMVAAFRGEIGHSTTPSRATLESHPSLLSNAKRATQRAARSSVRFNNRSANRTQSRPAHAVHWHHLHSEFAEIHLNLAANMNDLL